MRYKRIPNTDNRAGCEDGTCVFWEDNFCTAQEKDCVESPRNGIRTYYHFVKVKEILPNFIKTI